MAVNYRCRMRSLTRNFTRALTYQRCQACISKRWYSSQTNTDVNRDPGALFIQPEVQAILKRVTGFNLDKIFRERPTKALQPPKYQLLTDSQLEELQKKSVERGDMRLQMPPVMKAREDVEHVLANNPEVKGHDTQNYVFTDISLGLSNCSRVVVVREPSGKLRTANSEEHDRMLQTFLPPEGRMSHMPEMFQEQPLEVMLETGKYEYILDRACVQFEPDDPHYIRVTHRTYEHIGSRNEYEQLRSTRHFGGMAFYFAMYRKIEGLLADMIQRDLLTDAADLVRLFHILHPDCKSVQFLKGQQSTNPLELIELFVKHDASHGGAVELALQTYREFSATSGLQQTNS